MDSQTVSHRKETISKQRPRLPGVSNMLDGEPNWKLFVLWSESETQRMFSMLFLQNSNLYFIDVQ